MFFSKKKNETEVVRRLEFGDLSGVINKYIILDETKYLLEVINGEPQQLFTGGKRSFSIKDIFLNSLYPSRLIFYIMDASLIHGLIKVINNDEKKKKMYRKRGEREIYVSDYSLKSLDNKPVEVSVNLGIKINENLGSRILGMIKGKNLLETKDTLFSRTIWSNLDNLICGDVLAGLVSRRLYQDIQRDTDRITNEAVGKIRGDSSEITNHQITYGYGITEISLNWHLSDQEIINNKLDSTYKNIDEDEFTYGEFFIYLSVIIIVFLAIMAWIIF